MEETPRGPGEGGAGAENPTGPVPPRRVPPHGVPVHPVPPRPVSGPPVLPHVPEHTVPPAGHLGGHPIAPARRRPAPPVGRVAFHVGGSFRQAFQYLGRYGLLVLLLSALLHAPVALWVLDAARKAYDAAQETLFGIPQEVKSFQGVVTFSNILTSLFGLLLQSALAYGVYRHLHGKPAGLLESFTGLKRFHYALGVSLLVGLIVGALILVFSVLAVLLGMRGFGILVLLGGVVAAVLVYCAYFVGVQAAIVERIGPARALSRSAFLTRNQRGGVFLVVLAIYGTQFAATLLLQFVVFPDQETWSAMSGALVAGFAVQAVLTAFHAVIAAVVYHDLRRAKEGIGIEDLLKVFE